MEVVADVVADVSGIVRAELLLGRAETGDNIRALGASALRFGGGLLMVLLAATFGTVAMVVALAGVIGLIWALLLVTALCALFALLLLGRARKGLSTGRLLPEHSLARVAADLDRLSARAGRRWAGEDPGDDLEKERFRHG